MSFLYASSNIDTTGRILKIVTLVDVPPIVTTTNSAVAVGVTLTVDGVSYGLGVWNLDATTNAAGDTIEIAIDQQVGSGQTCTVSYVANTGQLHDSFDNLASFSNQAVTNNSTANTVSAYALTTLAGLKRFMPITDTTNDTHLTEVINEVSALIERVTGRNFLARDYRERYNGKFQRALTLKQYPVQHLTRISYGDANAMHLSYSGSAIRANASIYGPDSLDATGGLRLVTVSSTGTKTANNLSFATYGSVSALVTAVNLISGWSAATDVNVPSRDLNPTIAGDALGATVWLTYPDQDDATYTVDGESGIVQFAAMDESWFYGRYRSRPCERPFPFGFQGFLVEYNAGYSTIPDDVDLVCREICAEKYYAGQDNPAVKSETLGPYSVSFASVDDYAAAIRQRLAHYIDARSMIA